MKISIVTAAYNSGRTIRDTIQSVLNQTYSDIEYIIVDGASKDNTLDIVKEYEPLFQGRMRWVSEPDKGIYDAMNKGIAMATGDVVGTLNSDDLYKDNFVLESIAEAFKVHNVDCIYGNIEFVDENNIERITRTWVGSQHRNGDFLKGWHPAHPSFYCKRQYFDSLGAFDLSFAVSADFELMLRFIEKHHLSNFYIDKCIIKMREGGESTGTLKNIIIGNKNILRAFKKNGLKASKLYIFRRLYPKAVNKIKIKFKQAI